MNMAVTIDPRPTYFGDRMIVTGSTDGAETIDLSSLLASIDGAIANPIGSAATATTTGIDGATLDVGAACTFVAIGRRS
jgi:hypothetical protein|tara:strand:- start:255 stop:491 length:237 start_codon:yes stop_codon:yes gene_type:complete